MHRVLSATIWTSEPWFYSTCIRRVVYQTLFLSMVGHEGCKRSGGKERCTSFATSWSVFQLYNPGSLTNLWVVKAANASSVLNNERRKSHCSCSRAGCELCDRMPGCACAETEKSLPLLGQKCNMTKLSSVQSMTYYAPSRNAFIVRLYTTYMYTFNVYLYIYVHILYISYPYVFVYITYILQLQNYHIMIISYVV